MTHRQSALTFCAALGLAACGGDFGDSGDGSGGGNGNLRLVNASQTADLDLYESSTALSTSVPLSGAGSYVSLNRGSRALGVRAAGNTATLATPTVTVARDDHQALVAYQSAGSLQTAVLSEDEAAPTANNAKLRIFNAAQADAGNLDVYVVAGTLSCADVAAAMTAPTFSSVAGTPSSYAPFPATTVASRLCVTGVGVRTELRLDIASLVMTNLRIATIVLSRAPNTKLRALIIDQQGTVAALAGTAP